MPYGSSGRLPAEYASKLGHLDVLNSKLINELINAFEYSEVHNEPSEQWSSSADAKADPLNIIFSVDGSFQNIQSERHAFREVCFVKTALVRVDPYRLHDIDPEYPHPTKLQRLMKESAIYHSTVFPLSGIEFPSHTWLDGVRQIICDSLNDPRTRDIGIWETLKWIIYRKWTPELRSSSPNFSCPSCGEEIPGIPYDQDSYSCPNCNQNLSVADVMGFHMEMLEDGASQALATSYMTIHELLLLFSAIRYFWENGRSLLSRILFLKDGPLSLRGQYTKIVPNIRAFLQYAKNNGVPIHLVGQEKSGRFFEHLQLIERRVPPHSRKEPGSYFILSHDYVRRRIQRVNDAKYQYGVRTNYGEKVFVKPEPHSAMVLNVAVGEYDLKSDFPSSKDDLIGLDRILATIPSILSRQHEGGLIPIQLAHGVASLSSYPSAHILRVFAGLDS
jgi:hypothetical protein